MRALAPVIADHADVDWEDWADPANTSRHALRCTGPEALVFIFTFPRDRFEDIDYHLDG